MMVHVLAESYGWTIQYILSLSRRQIRLMFEGRNKWIEKNDPEKRKHRQQGVIVEGDKMKVNDPKFLMSMPGFSVSNKAKLALMKKDKDKN